MRKVFVSVECKYSAEAVPVIPLSFTWEDGTLYKIEKVFDFQKAASLLVGGQGFRYRCRVMNKTVNLFLEENKWFMEGK